MRNSILVAAAYIVVGFAILLAGALLYRVYDRTPDGTNARRMAGMGNPSRVTRSQNDGTVRLEHGAAQLARVQQRLNELDAKLLQTSAVLDQKTTLLKQKNAECQNLRADLDQTLELVFDMLAEEPQFHLDSLSAGSGETGEGDGLDPEIALERFRAEMRKAEFLDQEQSEQIDELKTELMRAHADIAETQMAAEEELAALAEARQAIETAASQSLIRTGKTAVPQLVRLLSNQRAEVRVWAAYVLGEIGADANEAAPSLVSLLADPVESVREEARQALAQIEPFGTP